MVDNIDKAFSDLTDPNRVINTQGFGTDFVKIAEESSEDLEELGITTDDIATLEPTMAVRSVGEFTRTKTPAVWQGQTLTFVEVLDDQVHTYYTED